LSYRGTNTLAQLLKFASTDFGIF